MKHIEVSIDRAMGHSKGDLIIVGTGLESGMKFRCYVEPYGERGNDDAGFTLSIVDGQVETGEIKMRGAWERQEFKELLETIIKYL